MGAGEVSKSNGPENEGGARGEVTMDLLRRYDKAGPRYTSYPTAVEFDESYTNETYHDRLVEADDLPGAPLSLYIHLPFCEERCTYCGCNVVITKKLCKGFGDNLLIDNLSFSLPRGGIVGIIGANGAGKTTLFRMIAGQETADSGTLTLGESVTSCTSPALLPSESDTPTPTSEVTKITVTTTNTKTNLFIDIPPVKSGLLVPRMHCKKK